MRSVRYGGGKLRLWTAALEDALDNWWKDFEVGERQERIHLLALGGVAAGHGSLQERRIWSVWLLAR